MRKVLDISIGNIIFAVEEDAQKELERYLQKLRSHVKGNTEIKDLVINDFEKRVAKRLLSQQFHPKRAITSVTIRAVIEKLGEPKSKGEMHSLVHRIIKHHKENSILKKTESILNKSLLLFQRLLGTLLLIISVSTLSILTFALLNNTQQSDIATLDSALNLFIHDYKIPTLIFSYFIALIPIIFLITISVSLLKHRSFFNPMIAGFLLGIWLVAIYAGAFSVAQIIPVLSAKKEKQTPIQYTIPAFGTRENNARLIPIEVLQAPALTDAPFEIPELE